MNGYTLPPAHEVEALTLAAKDWQHPAANPYAVVCEAVLSPATCDELVRIGEREGGYNVARCGATTRQYETHHAPYLASLRRQAERTNDQTWGYRVDNMRAWLQTYEPGGDYKLHMDAAPGQSRKLTAVLMLTDPDDYDGGDLIIRAVPGVAEYRIPRTRGTVVVFQPWLLHEVTRVTRGRRQTVNLGLWGPPLR